MSGFGIYIEKKLAEMGQVPSDLANAIEKSRGQVSQWLNGKTKPRPDVLRKIADYINADISELIELQTNHEQNRTAEDSEPYYKTRSRLKNEENQERDGIIMIPISAQAGYTQRYIDPIYINHLERIYMPGFPYKGDKYRVFEVDGSSMEPTFKEGFYVVCEKKEREGWINIPNYYTYVIITSDMVLLKRIFKKSPEEFILISDNEDFYPQFKISVSDICEIWQVKRKMDWEMAPPKKFEIKV